MNNFHDFKLKDLEMNQNNSKEETKLEKIIIDKRKLEKRRFGGGTSYIRRSFLNTQKKDLPVKDI